MGTYIIFTSLNKKVLLNFNLWSLVCSLSNRKTKIYQVPYILNISTTAVVVYPTKMLFSHVFWQNFYWWLNRTYHNTIPYYYSGNRFISCIGIKVFVKIHRTKIILFLGSRVGLISDCNDVFYSTNWSTLFYTIYFIRVLHNLLEGRGVMKHWFLFVLLYRVSATRVMDIILYYVDLKKRQVVRGTYA